MQRGLPAPPLGHEQLQSPSARSCSHSQPLGLMLMAGRSLMPQAPES